MNVPRLPATFNYSWSVPASASRSSPPGSACARHDLASYLAATTSPPASLMIRMRRLSDRFAKIRSQQDETQAD